MLPFFCRESLEYGLGTSLGKSGIPVEKICPRLARKLGFKKSFPKAVPKSVLTIVHKNYTDQKKCSGQLMSAKNTDGIPKKNGQGDYFRHSCRNCTEIPWSQN